MTKKISKTAVRKVLTRNKFLDWLKPRHDFVVGKAVECNGCPISQYLQDQFDHEYGFEVESESVCTIDITEDKIMIVVELPEWAVRFIKDVDHLRARGTMVKGSSAIASLKRVWNGNPAYLKRLSIE